MMLKLPEQFKTDWLIHLRAGQIKQTQGVLANWQGMCCLGVACVVHDAKTFKKMPGAGKGFITRHGAVHMPNPGDVPDEVLAVLKQSVHDVSPRDINDDEGTGYVQSFLSGKNDGGWSFSQIADWIEKHL